MKKWILGVGALLIFGSLSAQSVNDARKMIRYERYQSAIKMLQPMSTTNDEAKYYLGVAQLLNRDTVSALSTFGSLTDDNYKKAGMASISFAQNKNDEALAWVNLITKKVKKKEWLPYKLAGDATQNSNSEPVVRLGIDWYKSAIERNPDANLYISLGDLYRKLNGGGGDAMTAYQVATGIDPTNSLSYTRQAQLWYDAKVYDSVLVLYNKAKEYDPQNPLPYGELADVYTKIGKFELARTNIEKFLELSDKTGEDEVKYLNILFLTADYDKVITLGNQLVNSPNAKPYMYRLIGESYLQKGDIAQANTAFQEFFKKQPADKILYSDYLSMGEIMKDNGDSLSAQNYFTKATDMIKDPAKKADVMKMIANKEKDSKDYATSAYWFNKALPYSAKTKEDYFWAGYMSYYSGDYNTAVTVLDTMQVKYPDEPLGYYWGGKAKIALDDRAETGLAAPDLTKYLDLTKNETDKNDQRVKCMEYLATYAYNKGDKVKSKEYVTQILAIDPNDSIAKQLKEYLK